MVELRAEHGPVVEPEPGQSSGKEVRDMKNVERSDQLDATTVEQEEFLGKYVVHDKDSRPGCRIPMVGSGGTGFDVSDPRRKFVKWR